MNFICADLCAHESPANSAALRVLLLLVFHRRHAHTRQSLIDAPIQPVAQIDRTHADARGL